MPADRDRLARSQPLAGRLPQLVLAADDELACLIGLDPVFRLVAEIRPLADAARDPGPASCPVDGRAGGVDAEVLRPDRHGDGLPDSRCGGRVRDLAPNG